MEITITHVCDPCEYLILDNVCTPEELDRCFFEVDLLTPVLKTSDKTKNKNNGVILNDIYSPLLIQHSPTFIATSKILGTTRKQEYTVYSQMNFLKLINNTTLLLNGYKNNDCYFTNQNSSTLISVFWFSKHSFIGGDLFLKDFNHTIPFVSNRAVIFPSYYQHETTKIESNVDGVVQYNATGFLSICGPSNQPTTVGTNDF